MLVKHKFQSTKSDPSDSSLVGASKWNDAHDFEFPIGTTSNGGVSFSAGTLTLDLAIAEYFIFTLTANVTSISIANGPAAGRGRSFMLLLVQDATPRTLAWPSTFRWDGPAPSISATAGSASLIGGSILDGAKWDVSLSARS